jgi:hypothetical protein
MKTSCFKTFKGPGAISIARRAPRFFKGPSFKPLAPGPWFNSVDKTRYVELYKTEILSKLDPASIWEALSDLAGEAEPVLLCWEKPPFAGDNYCHRRMAAEWLENALGESIPEIWPSQ